MRSCYRHNLVRSSFHLTLYALSHITLQFPETVLSRALLFHPVAQTSFSHTKFFWHLSFQLFANTKSTVVSRPFLQWDYYPRRGCRSRIMNRGWRCQVVFLIHTAVIHMVESTLHIPRSCLFTFFGYLDWCRMTSWFLFAPPWLLKRPTIFLLTTLFVSSVYTKDTLCQDKARDPKPGACGRLRSRVWKRVGSTFPADPDVSDSGARGGEILVRVILLKSVSRVSPILKILFFSVNILSRSTFTFYYLLWSTGMLSQICPYFLLRFFFVFLILENSLLKSFANLSFPNCSCFSKKNKKNFWKPKKKVHCLVYL